MPEQSPNLPGELPSGEAIHLLVNIENKYEREFLTFALENQGFVVHACANPRDALRLLAKEPFLVRIVIIDLDCDTATDIKGSLLLARLQSFAEQHQYQFGCYFFGISYRSNNAELERSIRAKGAEFLSKADVPDVVRRVCAVALEIGETRYPQFMPLHVTHQAYIGHCVAGELISNICVRRRYQEWKKLPISEAPRFYTDAILRFSSEHNPLSGKAILQCMSLDPFYSHAIGEDLLTPRSFITNWSRIKDKGLRPIFGCEADEIAVSENRVGKETVYYFRGECMLKHIENPLIDDDG